MPTPHIRCRGDPERTRNLFPSGLKLVFSLSYLFKRLQTVRVKSMPFLSQANVAGRSGEQLYLVVFFQIFDPRCDAGWRQSKLSPSSSEAILMHNPDKQIHISQYIHTI